MGKQDPDRSRPAPASSKEDDQAARLRLIGESNKIHHLSHASQVNGVDTTTSLIRGELDAISLWISVNHGPERAAEVLAEALDAAALRVHEMRERDAAVIKGGAARR